MTTASDKKGERVSQVALFCKNNAQHTQIIHTKYNNIY